jgi:hypothetical protein
VYGAKYKSKLPWEIFEVGIVYRQFTVVVSEWLVFRLGEAIRERRKK